MKIKLDTVRSRLYIEPGEITTSCMLLDGMKDVLFCV